jgi:histidinol-phosphate aminotransferase
MAAPDREPRLAVSPNPVVASLRPYSPGRLAGGIELVLDSNESLDGPPEVGELARLVPLNRYPSRCPLEAQIAACHGCPAASVLVTAGADDALERAIRSVVVTGTQVLTTTPSFEMINRYVRLAGGDVVALEWWKGPWPVDEALARAGEDTALVVVVSPNNPTGAVVAAADLERLARSLPQCLIVLDHAYVEFADADLSALVLGLPNLVVLRTFSKAWGCAGLRVGYALGDPRVLKWMCSVGQPYSVSALSLAAVGRVLAGDGTTLRRRIAAVRSQRTHMTARLEGLGLEVLPSQANFVLARVGDGLWMRAALASLGIAVRAFADPPALTEWVRLTVPGTDDACKRLLAAIATVLAPEALLFDMDGVLVDVSRSYRQAIIETAAAFGVRLDAADISRAKAEGHANNDWELTRRLLAARGVEVGLAEVTGRFEELYQGTAASPGLRRHERLLVTRDELAALGARFRLGVVTGRPRRDAVRALEELGLDGLFATVVTLEDGPLKPDPAPVRRALEELGVTRAWMLGDTPDDLIAARSAGVLPIGVVAPGEAPERAHEVLTSSGAARVLGSVRQLLEVL